MSFLHNVLPYLQSFCNGQERAATHAETMQTVPIEVYGKNHMGQSHLSESSKKVSRNTNQLASPGGRRSIHERLASNKARIEAQPGKGNPVKGVERT